MSAAILNLTLPPGRVVGGSIYKQRTTDAEGKPLVVKHGPNAGQPRSEVSFAVAIAKQPGHTHWAYTEWGKKLWEFGHQVSPTMASNPIFSWKVIDGDSTIPNRKNNKPCENTGYPGHWVVWLSSGIAPKCYTLLGVTAGNNPLPLDQKDAINGGDYVEVSARIRFNESSQNPGIYINHEMVCLRGFGERISFGMDVAEAGFGAAALPPGASTVPVGAAAMPPGQPPAGGPPPSNTAPAPGYSAAMPPGTPGGLPGTGAPPMPPGGSNLPPPTTPAPPGFVNGQPPAAVAPVPGAGAPPPGAGAPPPARVGMRHPDPAYAGYVSYDNGATWQPG